HEEIDELRFCSGRKQKAHGVCMMAGEERYTRRRMDQSFLHRRDFLRQAGSLGSMAMMAGLSQGASAIGSGHSSIVEDAVQAEAPAEPKYHIKFAVCGMSHDHIYGMIGAIQRGGGEFVAAWAGEPDKLATFTKRFPNVKIAKSQEE